MNTIDKIMALADKYGLRCYVETAFEDGFVSEEREALRAAITEALDMGEPVAWRRPGRHQGWVYEDGITSFSKDPKAMALYAAKDKP